MKKWMWSLLKLVLTVMSPEIRKGLEDFLNDLDAKAKKTANPWDDIFVNLLRTVLLGE